MQNLRKIADSLLLDLIQKESKGLNISKEKFDFMIEAYKKDYEEEMNSSNLDYVQKKRMKALYNKAADNIKDYCQECLRINGRLVE